MSTIYDNWEILVGAVIKREQFRQMALAPPSRESSFSSRQSDLSSSASSYRHDEVTGVCEFRIIGNAEPGSKIKAYGYPENETILRLFQWVRYHPDGSVQYLDATSPEYLVTANDVGRVIALECLPIDDRGRKGDIVRAFANHSNMVECGTEMKENIEAYFSKGEAEFNVLIPMSKRGSSEWEPASLFTKRHSGFHVMVGTEQRVIIEEEYSEKLLIIIPGEVSTEFHLKCANGLSYPFRSTSSRMRDTIVLTIRIFQNKAAPPKRYNEEDKTKKVTFNDLVRSGKRDEPYTNGASKASTEPMIRDPTYYYHVPAPVLDESSSLFSKDDNSPPRIEGLQVSVSGEAFPGKKLQVCGYVVNGTCCNFQWVRYLKDGSFSSIDGAKQANYLLTADDIETYLAVQIQLMDERKQKGKLVQVFANEHRKITCDPKMQTNIEKTLYSGHASYKFLSLSSGYLDIWHPASLDIKRDGYTRKCTGTRGFSVTNKFSSSTIVSIPYGSPTEFSIGTDRLKVEDSITDIYNSRDTIVLSLRLFILKAGDKGNDSSSTNK